MNNDERANWDARIEAHKKQRRKRRPPSTHEVAAALWDGCAPPIKFENLVPSWRRLVVDFFAAAATDEYPNAEAVWRKISAWSRWEHLGPDWERTLNEAYRRAH